MADSADSASLSLQVRGQVSRLRAEALELLDRCKGEDPGYEGAAAFYWLIGENPSGETRPRSPVRQSR